MGLLVQHHLAQRIDQAGTEAAVVRAHAPGTAPSTSWRCPSSRRARCAPSCESAWARCGGRRWRAARTARGSCGRRNPTALNTVARVDTSAPAAASRPMPRASLITRLARAALGRRQQRGRGQHRRRRHPGLLHARSTARRAGPVGQAGRDQADAGESRPSAGRSCQGLFPNTRLQLLPPKPKELVSAWRSGVGRAAAGGTFTVNALGRGPVCPGLPGTKPSTRASAQSTASTAPAAPRVWPVAPLGGGTRHAVAEHGGHGLAFGAVVGRCGRAVQVDVLDVRPRSRTMPRAARPPWPACAPRPSGCGADMWCASLDSPAPSSHTALGGNPPGCRCPHAPATHQAAPSPIEMPSRPGVVGPAGARPR